MRELGGRSASISKEKVQAEHEEVKKQISILKLRRLRRELHEAADVEYYLSDMLLRFKNRLLGTSFGDRHGGVGTY